MSRRRQGCPKKPDECCPTRDKTVFVRPMRDLKEALVKTVDVMKVNLRKACVEGEVAAITEAQYC